MTDQQHGTASQGATLPSGVSDPLLDMLDTAGADTRARLAVLDDAGDRVLATAHALDELRPCA